jgi:hypothetical protein
MTKPPPYQSVLEQFPKHAKAIGMTTIEIANLDIFLGYLFSAILKIPAHVGKDIFLTPRAATARLDLLETAIDSMIAKNSAMKKHLISLHKRAWNIISQRHSKIHDLWGTNPAGEVGHKPARGVAQLKPVPLEELERMILDIRLLTGDVRSAALELERAASRAKPPEQDHHDRTRES